MRATAVLVSALLLVCASTHSQATAPHAGVIYGQDDRFLVGKEVPDDLLALVDRISQGTAVKVPKGELVPVDAGASFIVRTRNMMGDQEICPSERYAELPDLGACTGFLVGPDLLLTAGHCILGPVDCKLSYFVFDYRADKAKVTTFMGQADDPKDQWYQVHFPAKDVVACKQVLRRAYNKELFLDFALVRLERAPEGREALKYRKSDRKLRSESRLATVGHPRGIPQVVATNGMIRANEHPYYFLTNLDTYKGNSGSPVFNLATGEVEGMVISGNADMAVEFLKGPDGRLTGMKCHRSLVCADSDCDGEKVARITNIPELQEGPGVQEVLDHSQSWPEIDSGLGQGPPPGTGPETTPNPPLSGEDIDRCFFPEAEPPSDCGPVLDRLWGTAR